MFYVKKHHWKNWSESVHCYPENYVEPDSVEQVVQLVKSHYKLGRKMRVVGTGHSFTPLVATSETLLSLNRLTGIEKINQETKIATVRAGTKLKDLGNLLHDAGYAMENLGDINEQTIAGAISTGTHGTGKTFGTLSTQVAGLTIVTGKGDLLHIDEKSDKDLLSAAQTSLGLFGIIVSVDLKVEEAYFLKANSFKLPLNQCLTELDRLKEHRNMEFFWFPYTETVQVKTKDYYEGKVEKPAKLNYVNDVLIENGLFKLMSEASRIMKKSSPYMSKLSALGVPTGQSIGYSHHIFESIRQVKFNEMEYSIPEEKMAEVLLAIKELIKHKAYDVNFPIECRYVKGDDIWLSPAYARDSAFIAVHMYKGMEFTNFFKDVEAIFKSFDGRGHWGKMHDMTLADIKSQYTKFDDFLTLREELDPKQIFVNDYMKRLFAI